VADFPKKNKISIKVGTADIFFEIFEEQPIEKFKKEKSRFRNERMKYFSKK